VLVAVAPLSPVREAWLAWRHGVWQ